MKEKIEQIIPANQLLEPKEIPKIDKIAFLKEILDFNDLEIDYLDKLPSIAIQIEEYNKIYTQTKSTYPHIFETNPTKQVLKKKDAHEYKKFIEEKLHNPNFKNNPIELVILSRANLETIEELNESREAINASKMAVTNFRTKQKYLHIDGLFNIFKRGLYQVGKKIFADTQEKEVKSIEKKQKLLKKLFSIAKLYEDQKKMGLSFFLKINCLMTLVNDIEFPHTKSNKSSDDLLAENIVKSNTLSSLGFWAQDIRENEIEEILASSEIDRQLLGNDPVDPQGGLFHFPFVLYSLNKTTSKIISPKTFVNTYFDKNAPGEIFLYHMNVDILPLLSIYGDNNKLYKKNALSKKHPHYGGFNSINGLFRHDLLHVREQTLIKNEYTSIHNYTHNMDNDLLLLLESLDWRNDSSIQNALFILIHELRAIAPPSITPTDLTILKTHAKSEPAKINKDFFEEIKGCFIKSTEEERGVTYKYRYKDLEYILTSLPSEQLDIIKERMKLESPRNPDSENSSKNFFSFWAGSAKQKAVRIGYELFWDDIINKICLNNS